MPSGIYPRKPFTLDHKKNISSALKGKLPKNLYFLHNLPEHIELKKRKRIGLTNSKKLKGYKHTEEAKKNMSIARFGYKMDEDIKRKISLANTGKKHPTVTGNRHYLWKKDRSTLKKDEKKHLDTKYRYWMMEVKRRDGWKCRIINKDCSGRLESHHILNWKDYPELRYEIKNGITLCHAHHPRGRTKEKRLESYFMELVSVSKV